MERAELVEQFIDAWNKKDVAGVLKLMHAQASYHDAFWGEICSGKDLEKYFEIEIEADARWYRLDGDIIPTPNGLVSRYIAFDRSDHAGVVPLYNGAEVFTISGDLILTVSDHYYDPSKTDLIEIAAISDLKHSRAHIAPLGLSTRTSSRIKRRLKELATETSVYLDPSLTVSQLADHADCAVMHLFHVLEEEMDTTFLTFVNECRSRHASRLLVDVSFSEKRFDQIAKESGFESIKEFRKAFSATFGIGPDEYMEKFSR